MSDNLIKHRRDPQYYFVQYIHMFREMTVTLVDALPQITLSSQQSDQSESGQL